MIITRGTTLILSKGSYSDYNIIGPYMVIKDFNKRETYHSYMKDWAMRETKTEEEPNYTEFIAWLILHQYIDPDIKSYEWWLGDYGELDPYLGDNEKGGDD